MTERGPGTTAPYTTRARARVVMTYEACAAAQRFFEAAAVFQRVGCWPSARRRPGGVLTCCGRGQLTDRQSVTV